ncbi:MAG: [protein-PII] uridylyltransferase [Euzebya sp.]
MGTPGSPGLDTGAVDAPAGRPWSLQWTALVDAALHHHLRQFEAAPRDRVGGVALIALGSYARRSLCPQSDIDLLLIHDGWPHEDLQSLVQAICYPLWDAGLSVGHAVRTTKEAIRATGDRVDTATALTERRLVAGSQGLADDLSARMTRWLRRNGGTLATQIVQADGERRRLHGGTPGALEPDLKDGTGGLRDLHSLRWAGAIVLGGAPGLDPLVGARYLGADDRTRLATAGEALLRARCALHLVGGRNVGNALRLDLQDEVAAHLGLADGDELLREVGLATRTIAHLHARSWPVLLQDATRGRRRHRPGPRPVDEGVVLVDGLIQVEGDALMAADPSLGLRAVAAAARQQTVVGRHSAIRLRREIEHSGGLEWDDAARRSLLQILRSGRDGLAAMGDADYLGLWDAYLPEWQRVRGRPQRNPLHTFDLDTHAMQATAWLADIVAGGLDPRHAEIFDAMADPDAVVVGTWLHDVGKAWPGDHSESGETVARQWAGQMGFSEDCADRIARLVRLHLVLPDVATQRDIEDPQEVERVAIRIGDVETLDGLYLLTLADSRATGKAAWSEWKDLLIRQLYSSVRSVLLSEEDGPGGTNDQDVVLRAAARAGGQEETMRGLVAGVPARYLRSASPEQLAVHDQLVSRHGDQLVTDLRPGPVPSTMVLSLVAKDRHGLFSDTVGVLSAHRVSVQQARIFTHAGGTALDWFVVSPPPQIDWQAVVADLIRAEAGQMDVADAVNRRERARDVRPPVLAEPVGIRVTTSTSGGVTRVEVCGPDSPGVLFRVSRILADLGTELQAALVATLGPEVRDAFLVTGEVPSAQVLRSVLEPALLDSPAVA